MKSIKTKITTVMIVLVTLALLIGAAFLIFVNSREMEKEIALDALTYAELTNNAIVTSYQQFYTTQNFLQFRKEVNPLIAKNIDVSSLQITDKSGQILYDSLTEKDVVHTGEVRRGDIALDRIKNFKPPSNMPMALSFM
jgi:uncharacterized protein YneF (UPF0154 family)